MGGGTLGVGDIVGGGFRLIRARPGAVAVWGLLYLAMTVAMVFVLRPVMLDLMVARAAGAGVPGAPSPAIAALWPAIGKMLGVYLLMLLGLLILYTAALRAAVRPEESDFAYLRLGLDELRMLLVALVLGIGLFLLYVVLALVSGIIGGIVAVAARGAIFPVFLLLGLAVMAVLAVFYTRFSLAFALTMLREKVVIGASWNLTRNRFWTLFGAYLVLFLIVASAAVVLFGLAQGGIFAEMARGGFTPQAISLAQHHQMEQQWSHITTVTAIGWVLGAVFGAFWIALSAGAVGTAALGVLDDDFADIAAIYA